MYLSKLKRNYLNIIILSAVTSVLTIGCGGGGSDSVDSTSMITAKFVDAPVSGLDYKTDKNSGTTDANGNFYFYPTDKTVTFSVGNMIIGEFNLSNLNTDKKVLPSDLFGLDRNNTTDERIIKVIEFLQSLDEDQNITNGIQISDVTKNNISDEIDLNSSIKINLIDNDVENLKYLVTKINKKWVLERIARENYKKELISLGYDPDFMPFMMVWKVNKEDNITIPVNPKYLNEYNYTVDWGDGYVSKYVDGNVTHTYKKEGYYTVKIIGMFPAIFLNNDGQSVWDDSYIGNADKLVEIQKWGDIEWKSFNRAFMGAGNLTVTACDTPNLRKVKNMSGAFGDINTSIFTNNSINDWNVSNVTDMSWMFGTNFYFVITTNGQETYNLKNTFNQPLNNWDVSNVTDMNSMFAGATSYNQPLNNWDVSNVTNMSWMFGGATSFNQPLNNWDVSNVTDMNSMFAGATSFNQSLDSWDVSNVTNMSWMFGGAVSFNQPLDNWDVSNVTNMSFMFIGANNFNQPLNSWDVSNVTDMSGMFGTYVEITIYSDKQEIKEMNNSFNQPLDNWDVSNVTNMSFMFEGATSFNQSLDSWDVSNVTDMHWMFGGATSFNQPLNNWDVSNVTDMNSMFAGATSFNQSLDSWDVSNVTNMSWMFAGAVSFNQSLDNWDVSNVTDMNAMFGRATSFNQPLNNWDVSNVTDMSWMFGGAKEYNQSLNNWDVSNVTDMNRTFYYAELFDQNISMWDVSNVTDYTDFATGSPIDGTNKMPDFK